MALGFSPITQFSIAGHNRNTLMDIVLNLLPFTFYFLLFTFYLKGRRMEKYGPELA